MAMSPSTSTPFNVGQGFLAGASAIGLGGLVFYGLGFSNEVGAAEKAMIWPDYVKQRIRDTYMYFGASLGVTAGTAVAIFRSPAMMNIVMRQGWIAMGVSIVFMASIGSAFLPPTTALGAGLYSISLYGGLVLFSGFMLYNTQ